MSAPTAPGAALLGTARSWRGIVPFTHLAREGRMTVTIGRRELLVALGGAAAAWPLAARAQRMRRVGWLTSLAADDPVPQGYIAALLRACRNWAGASDAMFGSITAGAQ